VRTSAAVDRVVAILEFLAERPTESFSISELSRRLDISKATCHALIGSLIEAHWVMRNPRDKLVRVGPALIAAAALTAGRPRYLAELARADMEDLGQMYAAQGAASLAAGEEIVLIETYNPGNEAHAPMQVGNRVPLKPPNGFVYLAWGKDVLAGREQFQTEACSNVLSVIRQRGFSVTLEMDLPPNIERALRRVQTDTPAVEIEAVLASLVASLQLDDYSALHIDENKEYNVANISVPVLDDAENVVIALTLAGFGSLLSGSTILAIANGLKKIASTLTGHHLATA